MPLGIPGFLGKRRGSKSRFTILGSIPTPTPEHVTQINVVSYSPSQAKPYILHQRECCHYPSYRSSSSIGVPTRKYGLPNPVIGGKICIPEGSIQDCGVEWQYSNVLSEFPTQFHKHCVEAKLTATVRFSRDLGTAEVLFVRAQ